MTFRSDHLHRFHGLPVFALPAPGQGDGPFPSPYLVARRLSERHVFVAE
ncbi:hypothetical protein [Streptomyces sp. CO7]